MSDIIKAGDKLRLIEVPDHMVGYLTCGAVYTAVSVEDGLVEITTDLGGSAWLSKIRFSTDVTDTSAEDIVNQPEHYAKWAIEPVTFCMENDLEFWRGNIVKYAVRAGSKLYDGMDATQSEITDLKKVRRYAEMRINHLEGKEVL